MGFGKIGTAMLTPFDNKGNIDLQKTTTLIEYLIENGTDSLIIAGTTGESPTLTTEEKIALFKHVVHVVNGRIPVIAGTGSYDTRASIQLTQKAEALGVDGIMLVVPYYNKPNQRGLYAHFEAIAKSTSLPIMLYNIPGRASVNMTADTVIRLSEIPNIVAVKEASGDLEQMAAIIANTPDDFYLYSGDDSITLPVLAIGGEGVISVASHVIGKEMKIMIEAFAAGDKKKAMKYHHLLLPIMEGLFMAPSPAPLKTAMQMKGMDMGSVRLPLVPLTEQERNALYELLQQLEKALKEN